MSRHRFFVEYLRPPNSCAPIKLDVDYEITPAFDHATMHHIVKVARVRVGEEIDIVFRDFWKAFRCEVLTLSDKFVDVRILEVLSSPELPMKLELIWGWAKGDKNERIVRQAVELGVNALRPARFERCMKMPDEKKMVASIQRLQRIAESAASQAHRNVEPKVHEIVGIDSIVKLCEKYSLVMVAFEEYDGASITSVLDEAQVYLEKLQFDWDNYFNSPEPLIALVVGPEGGITHEEIEALTNAGARLVSLGCSILRVETACTAACAIAAERLRGFLSKQ